MTISALRQHAVTGIQQGLAIHQMLRRASFRAGGIECRQEVPKLSHLPGVVNREDASCDHCITVGLEGPEIQN